MKKHKKLRKRIRQHIARRLTKRQALLLLAILGVFLSVLIYANAVRSTMPSRLLTVHDRSTQRVILTQASTIRDALNDAGITVDTKDVVEPSIDSKLLSTDSGVIIYRARHVLVLDGSLKEKVLTPAASPNEIALAAGFDPIGEKDKVSFAKGNFVTDGASAVLVIKRTSLTPNKVGYKPNPNALTRSKGAQIFTDSSGVAHRETYYDLPMNIVIQTCGAGNSYTVRAADGAKVDKDGYILVAANYGIYPRCTIVETSMGPGKVYDTGGFALRYPHGFDLATDWSKADGI